MKKLPTNNYIEIKKEKKNLEGDNKKNEEVNEENPKNISEVKQK